MQPDTSDCQTSLPKAVEGEKFEPSATQYILILETWKFWPSAISQVNKQNQYQVQINLLMKGFDPNTVYDQKGWETGDW